MRSAGLWLLEPSLPALVARMAGAPWLPVQSRLEELDLIVRVRSCRAYIAGVRRLFARLRKGHTASQEMTNLRSSLRPLQDRFNAGCGGFRLLVIVSPT